MSGRPPGFNDTVAGRKEYKVLVEFDRHDNNDDDDDDDDDDITPKNPNP
jgi:hypothetical protein